MIIIGFTNHTSKILPRILCRHFKHCAPIIIAPDGTMTMYQFVRRHNVAQITLHMRDINLLTAHGWQFIYLPINVATNFDTQHAWTCVALTCNAIGIHERIITPYGLYKRISEMINIL